MAAAPVLSFRPTPRPARLYRLLGEFCHGSAENGGQADALVTARRLVTSSAVPRLNPEQAIQLSVDIQDRVLIIVAAD